LVLDSEFDGSSLPSQWCTGFYCQSGIGGGDNTYEQECYDPAQLVFDGTALDFDAVAKTETCLYQATDSEVQEPYASGMITTFGHWTFTYGYMEAKIWLPSGPDGIADWPAFWACGESWPDDGEIDVLEGMNGDPAATFHNAAGQQGPTFVPGTWAGGWHTYAADWEPGSITFYYDGQQVAQYTSGITSQPMFLILNLALSTQVTSPDTVPAQMRVAYVRVWQH